METSKYDDSITDKGNEIDHTNNASSSNSNSSILEIEHHFTKEDNQSKETSSYVSQDLKEEFDFKYLQEIQHNNNQDSFNNH